MSYRVPIVRTPDGTTSQTGIVECCRFDLALYFITLMLIADDFGDSYQLTLVVTEITRTETDTKR